MVMRLTAKGAKKAPTAVGVQDELNRRIGAVLSKDDQRSLAALMDRLSTALRSDRERDAVVAPAPKKKRNAAKKKTAKKRG